MENIKLLRAKVDKTDEKILKLIAQRLNLVKKIEKNKKKNHLKIKDSKREKEILTRLEKAANSHKLPLALVKKIWKLLFAMSYQL